MQYKITTITMNHRSGTKMYHLLRIDNIITGNCVLVKRWGKTGAWGQMDVMILNKSECEKEISSKIRGKEKNGYEFSVAPSVRMVQAIGQIELRKAIGAQYWVNLGASNLKYLDDTIDTYGVRDPILVEYEEINGRNVRKVGDPKYYDSKKVKIVTAPDISFEEKQKQDPLFGIF